MAHVANGPTNCQSGYPTISGEDVEDGVRGIRMNVGRRSGQALVVTLLVRHKMFSLREELEK